MYHSMDNADIMNMRIATHHRVAMKPRLVSWILVLGIAAAVAGCGSMKSPRTMTVDLSDPYRLKSLPAIIVSGDASTRVEPSDNSPTKLVKSTITDVLSILGNRELKQPGRSAERRQQVEQVIKRRVNFRQMPQRSLGLHGRNSVTGNDRNLRTSSLS